jgi:hypothetical protein
MVNATIILYRGNARVHLQGKNALQVLPGYKNGNEIHYSIGAPGTDLIVHDYRAQNIREAREAIKLQYQNGFAKSFNQQSWVEIRYNETTGMMEMDLREDLSPPDSQALPIIWMGVLENNLMPGYKVEWEMFKPVDDENTAFIAFIAPAISPAHS